jgi:hypothetical protein
MTDRLDTTRTDFHQYAAWKLGLIRVGISKKPSRAACLADAVLLASGPHSGRLNEYGRPDEYPLQKPLWEHHRFYGWFRAAPPVREWVRSLPVQHMWPAQLVEAWDNAGVGDMSDAADLVVVEVKAGPVRSCARCGQRGTLAERTLVYAAVTENGGRLYVCRGGCPASA